MCAGSIASCIAPLDLAGIRVSAPFPSPFVFDNGNLQTRLEIGWVEPCNAHRIVKRQATVKYLIPGAGADPRALVTHGRQARSIEGPLRVLRLSSGACQEAVEQRIDPEGDSSTTPPMVRWVGLGRTVPGFGPIPEGHVVLWKCNGRLKVPVHMGSLALDVTPPAVAVVHPLSQIPAGTSYGEGEDAVLNKVRRRPRWPLGEKSGEARGARTGSCEATRSRQTQQWLALLRSTSPSPPESVFFVGCARGTRHSGQFRNAPVVGRCRSARRRPA